MALHTKYRPSDFDLVVGNKEIVKSLKGHIKDKDASRTFMFAGPSGVGKTTLARIVASEFGAKDSAIFELNIADFRGIDAMRKITAETRYKVPGSPVSVYILDEVHQATPEAQNVILKALEEPPEHVFYVLCTTEPEKLLPTIRTRCQCYRLQPVDDEDMADLIVKVSEQEGIDIDEEVVLAIIDRAMGSPRLGLNLLEKCRNMANDLARAEPLLDSLIEANQRTPVTDVAEAILNMMKGPKGSEWKDVANYLRKRVLFSVDVRDLKYAIVYALGQITLSRPSDWSVQSLIVAEQSLDQMVHTEGGLVAVVYQIWALSPHTPGKQLGRAPQSYEESSKPTRSGRTRPQSKGKEKTGIMS